MEIKLSSMHSALIVGIGGGLPSQTADIRLGDVVVSVPHMGRSGVVQYDSGKSTPHGFVLTESLNAPPNFNLVLCQRSKAPSSRPWRAPSIMPMKLNSPQTARY